MRVVTHRALPVERQTVPPPQAAPHTGLYSRMRIRRPFIGWSGRSGTALTGGRAEGVAGAAMGGGGGAPGVAPAPDPRLARIVGVPPQSVAQQVGQWAPDNAFH